MDNINRIADINGGLRDTSGRQVEKGKKRERAKEEAVKSFGDIYDIRLQSAELNRNSADFKSQLLEEAGKDLNKVITSLDKLNAEKVVNQMPAQDILALFKLLK